MAAECRLCGAKGDLCRSHILPEFLYGPTYDEKHRFTILTKGRQSAQFGQRGLTERLLCRACEQHLSYYEKYAAEVMSGQLGHKFQRRGGRITISGIDYNLFKLFQISVLWRSSVSSLEFFRLVSLGPHEERLRKMIVGGSAGDPDEFGCVVVFSHDDGHDLSDTIFNPEPMRWFGCRMYKFLFAGAAWLYHCDSRRPSAYLQRLFLQRDGTLTGLTGNLADGQIGGAVARRLARR